MTTFLSGTLIVDDYNTIKTNIEAAQIASISDQIDFSTASPIGQLNNIYSNALGQINEALETLYSNLLVNSAEGDVLDRLSNITNTTRRIAANTTVICRLDFDQNATHPIGSIVLRPVGQVVQYTNTTEIVVAGAPINLSGLLFRATEPGSHVVVFGPSGVNSLSIIDSTNTGLVACRALSDLVPGRLVETDEELRIRRGEEIAAGGGSSVNALIAKLRSELDGVRSVQILTNTTPIEENNIPPHSFEAVVWAPGVSAEDIAQVIFDNKAAGDGTAGNATVVVTDSVNNEHFINFTIPTSISLTVDITVDVLASTYAGDTSVAEAIQNELTAYLKPGYDVKMSKITSIAHSVPGVFSVTGIIVNGVSNDYTIANNEYAQIDDIADITVTSIGVTP